MNTLNENDALGVVANSFKILGLPLCASQDEIRKAYKRLALIHHPDKGGSKEHFQALQNAYEILTGQAKEPQVTPEPSEPGESDLKSYFEKKAKKLNRLDLNMFHQVKFAPHSALDEEQDFFISLPINENSVRFDAMDFVGNVMAVKGRYFKVSSSLDEAYKMAISSGVTMGPLGRLHMDLQRKGREPDCVIYKIRITPRTLIDYFYDQNPTVFIPNIVSVYHCEYKQLTDAQYEKLNSHFEKGQRSELNAILSKLESYEPNFDKLKEFKLNTKEFIQKNHIATLELQDNSIQLLKAATQRVLAKSFSRIIPDTKVTNTSAGMSANTNKTGIAASSQAKIVKSYEGVNSQRATELNSALSFIMIRAKKSQNFEKSFITGVEKLKEDLSNNEKLYINSIAKDYFEGRIDTKLVKDNSSPPRNKK